jgi:hypothetical protein
MNKNCELRKHVVKLARCLYERQVTVHETQADVAVICELRKLCNIQQSFQ